MKNDREAREILLVFEAVQWEFGHIRYSLDNKIP